MVKTKQDQKDLLNLPLCKVMKCYISIWQSACMEDTSGPVPCWDLSLTLGDGDQETDKVLLSPREPGAWGSVSTGSRHRDKTKSLISAREGWLNTDGTGNNNQIICITKEELWFSSPIPSSQRAMYSIHCIHMYTEPQNHLNLAQTCPDELCNSLESPNPHQSSHTESLNH